MTADSHTAPVDASFVIQSRREPGAPGGGRTYATITCRSCGSTDETPLKDKNAGWARRIFKSRGWTVADRAGRHQCPTCGKGVRGLAGKSVREERREGGVHISFVGKNPATANRRDLLADSSLANGALNIAHVRTDDPNGPDHVQDVDPDLLKPERMAEALSHLGHVTQHVEAPAVARPPSPPMKTRSPKRKGPVEVAWKATGRPGSLPISPKPLNLPEYLVPPEPAKQYKRKLRGYRYPGDAAYTARAYLIACGNPEPQIGRDFIVWGDHDEIGWAPVTAHRQPELPLTPTVEPVAPTPEDPEPMTAPLLQPIPPSRPTRDKLLAIHEKLNVVYVTDGGGRYTGQWSDAKVAEDLDVPLAWVAEERFRVFGEGTDNESVNIALDKWRRDMTNRMARATERQAKAIEELLAVNTEIEAIQAWMSAGPKEAG